MSKIVKPILLDETGQAVVEKLHEIKEVLGKQKVTETDALAVSDSSVESISGEATTQAEINAENVVEIKKTKEYADAAEASAVQSGIYATQSGNSAATAVTAAEAAKNVVWKGTQEEYNSLEYINPNCIYFIINNR